MVKRQVFVAMSDIHSTFVFDWFRVFFLVVLVTMNSIGTRFRPCKNPIHATVHTPLQIRTNKHRCFVFCLGHTSLTCVPGIGKKNEHLLNQSGIEDLAAFYEKYRQTKSIPGFQAWLERDIGFTSYQAKMTTCGIAAKLGEIKEMNTGLTPICCPRRTNRHDEESEILVLDKHIGSDKRSISSDEQDSITATEMKRTKSERSSWNSLGNLSAQEKRETHELSSALQSSISSDSVVSDRWRPKSTLSHFSEDPRERNDRLKESHAIRQLCQWKGCRHRFAWHSKTPYVSGSRWYPRQPSHITDTDRRRSRLFREESVDPLRCEPYPFIAWFEPTDLTEIECRTDCTW